MAYDSARGDVVLFGGWDIAPNAETWEYALPSVADLDGDGDADLDDATILINVLIGLDTNPDHLGRADIDRSGNVDGLDIQPLVNALLGT